MAVNQLDLLSKETHLVVKALEPYRAVSVSAVTASSAATVNVLTKISVTLSTMPSSADPTTDLMLSAAVEEIACAVNATATLVRTRKKSSVEHSVNAITSRATETTEFSALDLTVVSVNVEHATVTMDGVEMLANAAVQSKLAKHQTVKSALAMESATVVGANVKSKMT